MSAVRTYNPSVRVGNWNEDLCLEEDQLKDFLDKKDKNQLLIQKATNLLKTLLRPVELSKPSDGYIHIGDAVCLMHVPTKSVVSAFMSALSAHEAVKILPNTKVTCSQSTQPCPRNIFVIGSYDSKAKVGDPVCYEQLITFTTLPDEGGQLHLETDRASFQVHSRFTREQELILKEEISYRSAWKILCFNQEDRLETAGMPVPTNELIFINHSKTNMHLAVHTEWKHKTPYGREFEITGCTKFNKFKAEDIHNHFIVVTGNMEELLSKLDTTTND